MQCYFVPHYVMLCYMMCSRSCCKMLGHAMSCHVMLVMLLKLCYMVI